MKGSRESIRSPGVSEGEALDGQGRPQMHAEHRRLEETRSKTAPWRKWGPYLSERQWGPPA